MGPCAALGVNTQLICILFAYLHNEPNWLQMNRCASLPGCALPGLAAVGFAVGCCSGGTQQRFGCLLPDPFSALVAAPLLIPSLQFLSILLFLTLPTVPRARPSRDLWVPCVVLTKKQKSPEFRSALKLQGQGARALFPTPGTANTAFGFAIGTA